MPQLDVSTYSSQIAWLVITFLVLFLIMWKVIVPRIAGALEARQRRMDENLARAAELQQEAETLLAAYEESLSEARSEAQKTISEAAQRASEEASQRHEELGEALSKRIADSEAAIDDARKEALAGIREAASEAAAAATERLIGEMPDANTVSGAVDAAVKARA